MTRDRASKLDLDPARSARARALAARAGRPVVELARSHTTVSVERAMLRLAGIDGRRPGRHSVGQPARRRGRAPTSGLGARGGAAGVGRAGRGEGTTT